MISDGLTVIFVGNGNFNLYFFRKGKHTKFVLNCFTSNSHNEINFSGQRCRVVPVGFSLVYAPLVHIFWAQVMALIATL